MSTALRSMRVVLVEPWAHYDGHYPEEVKALARGILENGCEPEIVTLMGFLGGVSEVPVPHYSVFRDKPAFYRKLVGRIRAWRNNDGVRIPIARAFLAGLETFCCLIAAFRRYRLLDCSFICVSGELTAVLLLALIFPRHRVTYILRDIGRSQDRPIGWTQVLRRRVENGLSNLVAYRTATRFSAIGAELALDYRRTGFVPLVEYIPPVGLPDVVPVPREHARGKLDLAPEELCILVFGVGHPGKNYPVIFEALRDPLPRRVCLIFAGRGKGDNDPTALISRSTISCRVVVRDAFIPDADVPVFFCAADFVLLPYRKGYEIDSGVYNMAIGYGIPLIYSDGKGERSSVPNTLIGFQFEADSVRDLRRALVGACELDAQGWVALQEGVLAARANRWTWARIADAHLALLGRQSPSELSSCRPKVVTAKSNSPPGARL